MARTKWGLSGGGAGNEHLTAVVAAVLIVLLAIEGATLLRIGSLLAGRSTCAEASPTSLSACSLPR